MKAEYIEASFFFNVYLLDEGCFLGVVLKPDCYLDALKSEGVGISCVTCFCDLCDCQSLYLF